MLTIQSFNGSSKLGWSTAWILIDFTIRWGHGSLTHRNPSLLKQFLNQLLAVFLMVVLHGTSLLLWCHVFRFFHVNAMKMSLEDPIFQRLEGNSHTDSVGSQVMVGHMESIVYFVQFIIDKYSQSLECPCCHMTFTTQFIPLNCAVLKRKND